MFQAMLCDDNEIILEGLSRQIDWEGLGICLPALLPTDRMPEPDEG